MEWKGTSLESASTPLILQKAKKKDVEKKPPFDYRDDHDHTMRMLMCLNK